MCVVSLNLWLLWEAGLRGQRLEVRGQKAEALWSAKGFVCYGLVEEGILLRLLKLTKGG